MPVGKIKSDLISTQQAKWSWPIGKSYSTYLINLISNANKFSNSETISIDIKQQDQSIVCDVSDNGVGIPQEDLERIFMPFEQVYNELNREFEGTGLGLAICRQYARSMGGEISVQSKLKVGSTFRLTLPAAG